MNYSPITYKTCGLALLHFWKRVIAIFLIFALIGAAAGYCYVTFTDDRASGASVNLATPIYEPELYTAKYYEDRFDLITESANNLKTLHSALQHYVADPKDSSLLEDSLHTKTTNEDTLRSLSTRLKVLFENELSVVENQLVDSYCIPEKFQKSRELTVKRLIKESENKVRISSEATELLKTMDAPEQTNEETILEYNTLLTRARALGDAMIELEQLQYEQEMLCNPNAIAINNNIMDSSMSDIEDGLDVLYQQTEVLMQNIAEVQNLILTAGIGADPNSDSEVFSLCVTHTHGEVDPKEDFASVTTFFALCGLCVGFFSALCAEARTSKKNKCE